MNARPRRARDDRGSTGRSRGAVGPGPSESTSAAARETDKPPVRTCIGCRGRGGRSDMLRVVAARPAPDGAPVEVRPDPGRGMPGRGAWLHFATDCLEQAERRRAFGRALRIPGVVDIERVRDHLEGRAQEHLDDPSAGRRATEETESGFDADEQPMSTQR